MGLRHHNVMITTLEYYWLEQCPGCILGQSWTMWLCLMRMVGPYPYGMVVPHRKLVVEIIRVSRGFV